MKGLISLDGNKYGQARLTSVKTWGDLEMPVRQELASRVADAFQRKLAKLEIEARWLPALAAVKMERGKAPARRLLESLIEESYSEVKATLS